MKSNKVLSIFFVLVGYLISSVFVNYVAVSVHFIVYLTVVVWPWFF